MCVVAVRMRRLGLIHVLRVVLDHALIQQHPSAVAVSSTFVGFWHVAKCKSGLSRGYDKQDILNILIGIKRFLNIAFYIRQIRFLSKTRFTSTDLVNTYVLEISVKSGP